ncbi:MAG: hypothetical protein ABI343_05985 [Burkholderiaceae bacterium]
MNTTKTPSKASLTTVHVLASLLERLENSQVPVGADQYRSVVLHLVEEFNAIEPDASLASLLDSHPAAAQLYENVKYAHAGLCRSSLETSLAAELQAKSVIERAMRSPREGSINVQS